MPHKAAAGAGRRLHAHASALPPAVRALLWAAAMGLYAISYWPVLTRARLDGKPG